MAHKLQDPRPEDLSFFVRVARTTKDGYPLRVYVKEVPPYGEAHISILSTYCADNNSVEDAINHAFNGILYNEALRDG